MPDTRDHILYDSIHIKCPEKVNPYRKQISGCMGLEAGTKLTLNRHEKYYWDNEVLKLISSEGCIAWFRLLKITKDY